MNTTQDLVDIFEANRARRLSAYEQAELDLKELARLIDELAELVS